MRRKNPLITGQYYHVFNKSIAGFRIFNGAQEYIRMLNTIRYYQCKELPASFSYFSRLVAVESAGLDYSLNRLSDDNEKLVRIIAFCLMPTHVHFLIEQLEENGISIFMGNSLNSYARYFNKKYRRAGPLWTGRFKEVLVKTDEQLLHLSRYIHLNPTTANLVKKPEDWEYSSYREYVSGEFAKNKISCRDRVIDLTSWEYRRFTNDQIGYQRELNSLKKLVIE